VDLRNGIDLTGKAYSASVFKLVFAKRFNIAVAAGSAFALWAVFNILDGLILLSPVLTFYLPIPEDALPGFVLSVVTAVLAGVIITMNIFLFNSGSHMAKASMLSGSSLGTISSVCASCSSIGFYLASTFGFAGVAASSFMSTYQLPLRIAAVGILVFALVSAQRRIQKTCKMPT